MKWLLLAVGAWICLFSGLNVADGGDSGCSNLQAVVGPCFESLERGINSTLQSTYNLTYERIMNESSSIQNLTHYITLAARDELCSSSNQVTVDCLLSNLNNCPDATIDTSQFLFTDYVTDDLKTQNTTAGLCSYYRARTCEVRKLIFTDCYGIIMPKVQTGFTTDVSTQRTCLEEFRPYMNCMLESYKECDDVLFLDLNLFGALPTDMVNDNWSLFSDGGDICTCRVKTGSQRSLDNVLARYSSRSTSPTVKEEYEKVLGYADSLCGVKQQAIESYTVFSPLCNRTTGAFRMVSYKRYHDFTQLVCTDVESQDFQDDKQCVIDRLSKDLTDCFNAMTKSSQDTSCREINQLYICLKVILQFRCGEQFTRTIFEVYRDYYDFSRTCEISSLGNNVVLSSVMLVFPMVLFSRFVLYSF